MSLLYAVGLLSAAVLIARPFYLANRLPRIPWWAGSGITTCIVMLATGNENMSLWPRSNLFFVYNSEDKTSRPRPSVVTLTPKLKSSIRDNERIRL